MKTGAKCNPAVGEKLTRLAAGELGRVAAWRLRRRIARDPSAAAEWEQARNVWSALTGLRAPVSSLPLPAWPDPAASAGRVAAPRRRLLRPAIATASLVGVLALSGALAVRLRAPHLPQYAARDAGNRPWFMEGAFTGKAHIVDRNGRDLVAPWANDTGVGDGYRIHVKFAGREIGVYQGPGKHALRDGGGRLLAYLYVSPLSAEARAYVQREAEKSRTTVEDLYSRAERFTPDDGTRGHANPFSSPGLAGGYFARQGVAWKVVGWVRVKAVCLAGARAETQTAASRPLPVADDYPPAWRAEVMAVAELAPKRSAVPVLRWSIALADHREPVDGLLSAGEYRIRDGRWTAVRKSGAFTGYGRHTVRDGGRVVLVVDVMPL